MQSCMRSWVSPVFDRKEGKRDTLLSLDDRAERLDRFYDLIKSSGEKIHFLLKVIIPLKTDFQLFDLLLFELIYCKSFNYHPRLFFLQSMNSLCLYFYRGRALSGF